MSHDQPLMSHDQPFNVPLMGHSCFNFLDLLSRYHRASSAPQIKYWMSHYAPQLKLRFRLMMSNDWLLDVRLRGHYCYRASGLISTYHWGYYSILSGISITRTWSIDVWLIDHSMFDRWVIHAPAYHNYYLHTIGHTYSISPGILCCSFILKWTQNHLCLLHHIILLVAILAIHNGSIVR